ncbi:MAG TPA: hypothetical protein DCR93_15395 [Cytophagales bacterium]|nr:hypothetical protein [Cytophagales bacterium]HAP60816.1 hypothetical protein [Cytophagales bacterium]
MHNAKMAIFELHPAETGYQLKVQFDRGPLLNAMFGICPDFNEMDACFDAYLQEHVSVSLNGQNIPLLLQSRSYDDHHVLMEVDLQGFAEEINKVSVQITTLLEVEEQYNIFRIFVGPRVRSFQLNKDRIKTEFEL